MKISVAGLVFLAAPVAAQEVTNCEEDTLFGERWGSASCEVTNDTETPIASVRYGLRLTEAGRTVPWVEEGFEGPPRVMPISGGIEPGETVEMRFPVRSLPARADPDALKVEVGIVQAFDMNGEPIN